MREVSLAHRQRMSWFVGFCGFTWRCLGFCLACGGRGEQWLLDLWRTLGFWELRPRSLHAKFMLQSIEPSSQSPDLGSDLADSEMFGIFPKHLNIHSCALIYIPKC